MFRDDHGADDDVLRRLPTGTVVKHEVERVLDLLDPALGRQRLAHAPDLMHVPWRDAEEGLERWAARRPADAEQLQWLRRRRRTALFARDLAELGAAASDRALESPVVSGTDETLGRVNVLEGSTRGGVFIDRHLAGLPELVGVTIRAFPPMAARPGPCGWRSGA